MKARVCLKVLAWLLPALLLLTQIGAGFFHDEHDAHKNTVVLGAGEFAVQEHGEHCKLCSIDLITLYYAPPGSLIELADPQQRFVLPIVTRISVPKTFASDRAPPVIA